MCPDTARTRDTICAYAGCTKQVWKDPDGSFSLFCGLTHRDAMAVNGVTLTICKHCQQRPVYVENGREHDYCGKRCASLAGQGNPSPRNNQPQTPLKAVCCTPGCTLAVFVGQDGTPSKWCSQRHRKLALKSGAEACLLCSKMPKALINNVVSDYCSRGCSQATLDLAPIILSINYHYEKYKEISQQFMDSWKHQTKIPTVIKVWRIIGLKSLVDDFSRYKLNVERRRGSDANCVRRWHGTVRCCKLGDDGSQAALCQNTDCSLCRIIESFFNVAKFQQRTNFGRFGAGIYTSATSSKANDYVLERGNSPYKAMLLNEVVMGKAIKLYTDQQSLTEPPAGYDSVIGEPGNILNYDEAIVYKNEAIRPLYLIIYS